MSNLSRFTDEDRDTFSKMRVVILSPIMHIEPQWVRASFNMIGYSCRQGLNIYETGITERTVVQWARNSLAKMALERKCFEDNKPFTHALWLDTDHVFNPDMACQLATHFKYPMVDMVSALYFGREEPYFPIAYVKDNTDDKYKHFPIIEVPNMLCEVDAIGFGGLMCKLDVFRRVPEPWFTLDWRGGEDIAFCVKAKEYGVRIFLDGQYKMGHFGAKQIVTEKINKEYYESNKAQFGDKVKIGLGGINYDSKKS